MAYLLSPIRSRNDFGTLLTRMKLLSNAVEVGTHLGDFAKQLLMRWGGKLACIDPWYTLPGYESQTKFLVSIGGGVNRQEDYEQCKKNLDEYKQRVLYMRCTSREGVRQFGPESLDFVHIDGDHSREHVRQDLAMWWPKVKIGGILAGHDWMSYNTGKEDDWARNIQPEVHQFAQDRGLDVHLVIEQEHIELPWSYYMIKEVD